MNASQLSVEIPITDGNFMHFKKGFIMKFTCATEARLSDLEFKKRQWVGFDLDGTLATYDKFISWDHIGEPITAMVDKVKELLGKGIKCKILTARASEESRSLNNITFQQIERVIKDWCAKHIGQELEVVSEKGALMIAFYDDKAIQVEMNTGKILGKQLPIDAGLEFDKPITEISTDETSGSIEHNTFEVVRDQIDQICTGLVKGGFTTAMPPDDWSGAQWIIDAKSSDTISRISVDTLVADYKGTRTKFLEIIVSVAAGANKMLFKVDDTDMRSLGKWLAERIFNK